MVTKQRWSDRGLAVSRFNRGNAVEHDLRTAGSWLHILADELSELT